MHPHNTRPPAPPQAPQSASEAFYDAVLPRIRCYMTGLGIGLTIVTAAWLGWRVALGFAVGAVIAYINFHWLKRTVSSLAEGLTTGRRPSGTLVVLRFVARYLLMAVAAYAIFKISSVSLNGLFAGLFLPVAAIMCEAVFEVFMALRHGLQ